jgi:hypothetical protein
MEKIFELCDLITDKKVKLDIITLEANKCTKGKGDDAYGSITHNER